MDRNVSARTFTPTFTTQKLRIHAKADACVQNYDDALGTQIDAYVAHLFQSLLWKDSDCITDAPLQCSNPDGPSQRFNLSFGGLNRMQMTAFKIRIWMPGFRVRLGSVSLWTNCRTLLRGKILPSRRTVSSTSKTESFPSIRKFYKNGKERQI